MIRRIFKHEGWVAIIMFVSSFFFSATTIAHAEEACLLSPGSQCPSANLSGQDLRGHLVAMINLSNANLQGANLAGLVLWKGNLSGADLTGANLSDTFLAGADLRGADLSGADLSRAFLFRSFSDGANFKGARLSGARWIDGSICDESSIGSCNSVPRDAIVPLPIAGGLPRWYVAAQTKAAPSASSMGAVVAAAPAHSSAAATPQLAPTMHFKRSYESVVPVKTLLPSSNPRPTDGASILGYSFIPSRSDAVLRIRVIGSAYAVEPTEFVVALFRDGDERALKVSSKRVGAREQALIEMDIETKARTSSPINFQVRIGTNDLGGIVLNGPQAGRPFSVPPPSLSIDEIK